MIENGVMAVKGSWKTAFVLSGFGAEWEGMAAELFDKEPVFREAVMACDALHAHTAGWSIAEEIFRKKSRNCVGNAEVATPCLFAIHVALARLFQSFGIDPDGVVGHSAAEIAAAHISGALSLKDAMDVINHSCEVMRRGIGTGKMAHVSLSHEKIVKFRERNQADFSIAAINSPHGTVIAGEERALHHWLGELQKEGIPCGMLSSNLPFHCPAVNSDREDFTHLLNDIHPVDSCIPFFSTLMGKRVDGRTLTAPHWTRHIRETVRFEPALREMIQEGYNLFLDMGIHPVLSPYICECFDTGIPGNVLIVETLKRGSRDSDQIMHAMARLSVRGIKIDQTRLALGERAKLESITAVIRHEIENATSLKAPGDQPVEERILELARSLMTSLASSFQRMGIDWDAFRTDELATLPFIDLGVNSLMAVELHNIIRCTWGVEIPLAEFLGGSSALDLAQSVIGRTANAPFNPPSSEPLTGIMENEWFPLSRGQQALWFLHHLSPEGASYNIVYAARLQADTDLPALRKALQRIRVRQGALRTVYAAENGTPRQRTVDDHDFNLPVMDVSSWREDDLRKWIHVESDKPFDLERGPVQRLHLLAGWRDSTKGNQAFPLLVMTVHHIAFDFWSLDLFVDELSAIYRSTISGDTGDLPPLRLQYRDYVRWEMEKLAGAEGESLWGFWSKGFAGEIPVLDLPTDHPRPPVQSFSGKTHSFRLRKVVDRRARDLAHSTGSTLYTLLLSAFAALLFRYTGQENFYIGTPMAGRNRKELEALIGYFVNPLPIEADLQGSPSFRELISRVRTAVLAALDHQDYPLPLLVERLKIPRDPSRSPLFQTVFVWHQPRLDRDLNGFKKTGPIAEVIIAEQRGSAFDLILTCLDQGPSLTLSFTYNTDLFDEETILRMAGHFETLLDGLTAAPDRTIAGISLLSEGERQQLVVDWNDTSTEYPRDRCIHECFAAQAEKRPHAPALRCGEREITYRQLNAMANQIAHVLRDCGVGPDVPVGLCMERSVELIAALIGILKAGGAYVPLDPLYPNERLSFMIKDSQTKVFIAHDHLLPRLPQQGVNILSPEKDRERFLQASTGNPENRNTPTSLAYIMYTSGSTGTPKGVAVMHRGVVRLVLNTNLARFDPGQVWLCFAPISFDASTYEIWSALLNGAQLAIMPPTMPSLDDLGGWIRRYKVSSLFLTTGLFHLMIDERIEDFGTVKQMLVGGDVLSPAHANRFIARFPDCTLINAYGPTENSVATTRYIVTEPIRTGQSVPIGRTISNTRSYVLAPLRQPVPIGVAGELYTGGDGVARGYVNRPDATARSFIPDPFSQDPEARLYRTGDRVRYLRDGNIEFLGRMDTQVKIRGFRIEPGEIEAALVSLTAVKEAAVILVGDSSEQKKLVAFIVPAPGENPSPEELKGQLQDRLPIHMVPSRFISIAELPLSPNGKLDRKRLALLAMSGDPESDAMQRPETEVQEEILKIWTDVIGIEHIGIHDNFFDLGGNSLAGAQVISKANRRFDVQLSLQAFFESPTICAFARHVEAALATAPGLLHQPPPATSVADGTQTTIQPLQGKPLGASLLRNLIRAFLLPLVKLTLTGQEHIPEKGPLILASNHINWLDFPVYFIGIAHCFRHISPCPTIIAADRWRPWFHWLFTKVGKPLYISRGRGDVEALQGAITVLRQGGMVNIAPEGTFDHGRLIPGQVGVAYLATQVSAPVLPIVSYGQDRLLSHWARLHRVPIEIRIGKPITLPAGESNHHDLRRHTDTIMSALAEMLPAEKRGVYGAGNPSDTSLTAEEEYGRRTNRHGQDQPQKASFRK